MIFKNKKRYQNSFPENQYYDAAKGVLSDAIFKFSGIE